MFILSQVSLYIDDSIIRQIELAAKIERTSISKWVSRILTEHIKNSWPKNYDKLYGCIREDSFGIK